jgi:hypothetical protein
VSKAVKHDFNKPYGDHEGYALGEYKTQRVKRWCFRCSEWIPSDNLDDECPRRVMRFDSGVFIDGTDEFEKRWKRAWLARLRFNLSWHVVKRRLRAVKQGVAAPLLRQYYHWRWPDGDMTKETPVVRVVGWAAWLSAHRFRAYARARAKTGALLDARLAG